MVKEQNWILLLMGSELSSEKSPFVVRNWNLFGYRN